MSYRRNLLTTNYERNSSSGQRSRERFSKVEQRGALGNEDRYTGGGRLVDYSYGAGAVPPGERNSEESGG